MSWDVVLKSTHEAMGTKENARETLLSAFEKIVGEDVPRRGPTEVRIDPSFCYEVYFIGHKRAIESLSLGIKIQEGAPHMNPQHPVWSFLKQLSVHTGWEVHDTHTGAKVEFDK